MPRRPEYAATSASDAISLLNRTLRQVVASHGVDTGGDGQLWRIGELARASGLSVRALHHYEDLGLMSAHRRTSGGHRLYDVEDVRRLYQIRALRDLGLSLTDVAAVLHGSVTIEAVVTRHLHRVESRLAHLMSLREWLAAAGSQAAAQPSTASMLATLEAMSVLAAHARNSPPTDTRSDWRTLGEQLRTRRDAGDAACAPGVLALARAGRKLVGRYAGNDPAVLEALTLLRRSSPQLNAEGWDQALIEFFDHALTALDDQESSQ